MLLTAKACGRLVTGDIAAGLGIGWEHSCNVYLCPKWRVGMLLCALDSSHSGCEHEEQWQDRPD